MTYTITWSLPGTTQHLVSTSPAVPCNTVAFDDAGVCTKRVTAGDVSHRRDSSMAYLIKWMSEVRVPHRT